MADRNIWDSLRKKYVAATPEEEVRQWFIGQLASVFKVPAHMMMSEVAFRFGDKKYRADIVVYDRKAEPLMVVECKMPSVDLDAKVVEQTMRYNSVLSVKYMILTNGRKSYLYKFENGVFVSMDKTLTYEEMLCQQ